MQLHFPINPSQFPRGLLIVCGFFCNGNGSTRLTKHVVSFFTTIVWRTLSSYCALGRDPKVRRWCGCEAADRWHGCTNSRSFRAGRRQKAWPTTIIAILKPFGAAYECQACRLPSWHFLVRACLSPGMPGDETRDRWRGPTPSSMSCFSLLTFCRRLCPYRLLERTARPFPCFCDRPSPRHLPLYPSLPSRSFLRRVLFPSLASPHSR